MGIIDVYFVLMLKDVYVFYVNGMMVVFGVFIIIGGLLVGWLLDFFGSRSVMLFILFFIWLISLICLFIFIFGIYYSEFWYFGFILLFGFSYIGVILLIVVFILESY